MRWKRLTFCYIMDYGELYAPAGVGRCKPQICSARHSSAPMPCRFRSCLSVLTPSAPEMRLMSPILYMWSAILSGPFTLHLIHPVLFDVYKQAYRSESDSLYVCPADEPSALQWTVGHAALTHFEVLHKVQKVDGLGC